MTQVIPRIEVARTEVTFKLNREIKVPFYSIKSKYTDSDPEKVTKSYRYTLSCSLTSFFIKCHFLYD